MSRGITPAYAGKSEASYFFDKRQLGSPPPMRGKDGDARVYGNARGITPAYAGKRRSPAWEISTTRDHPRLCGEKQLGRLKP